MTRMGLRGRTDAASARKEPGPLPAQQQQRSDLRDSTVTSPLERDPNGLGRTDLEGTDSEGADSDGADSEEAAGKEPRGRRGRKRRGARTAA